MNIDDKHINDDWFKPFSLSNQPTPEQVRSVISQLNWSNAQIARLVGVNDGKQVRRWKAGQSKIPFAAWSILGYWCGHRNSCFTEEAKEVALRPNLKILKDDINSIDINGGETRLNSFGNGFAVVSHKGVKQNGLEIWEDFKINIENMKPIEVVEFVSEKILKLYD